MKLLSFCLLILTTLTLIEGYRIAQVQDSYPWQSCNSFEVGIKVNAVNMIIVIAEFAFAGHQKKLSSR